MKEQEKVLFVVYRTEWWGCLDNLCRQECLGEDTLVYVMPIPRYERELGTTKINYNKAHCHPELLEGKLPPGARLADYRTFSVEQGFERIYIHNPYDNTYFVDSVDGKYYSWNLKPYAKKLIYVSYLLYIDEIPEEFANSSVYEHVDAIYLADKQAKYSLDVEYDKKVEIVPSGIPEYLARLEEGLKCGKQNGEDRKDGQDSRKKLLCCLSYNNLYYGSEKLIQKLRDVFEYIRGRKDILLIFRPDEDIRLRFPWLDEPVRKNYAALVAYFQKNRVGIYDEGPDLYRAVAEADGIMSFGHPADRLFSVQGKYVLRLDNELRPIPSDEVRCIPSLWAMTAVEEEDGIELWFVPEQTKLICRIVLHEDVAGKGREQKKGKKALKKQIESPEVEVVAEVPDEAAGGLSYISITKMENSLYLSPFNSESIWKYDLNTQCFSGQFLPNAIGQCMTAAFPYGKYLYLIPRMYPGIVKYNMETEEIKIFDEWVEKLEHYVIPEYKKEPYFIWAVKQEKNMLYMASSKCDVWMEFDMDRDVWHMKHMELKGKCFIDMVKRKEWVWLFPWHGDEIILWNSMTNERQVMYRTINKEGVYAPYEFGLDIGDFIAAFPKEMDNLLLIPEMLKDNLLKGNMEQNVKISSKAPSRKKDYLSDYQRQRKTGYQFVKRMKNGKILAYEYYDGAFLVLNEIFDIIQKHYCRFPLEVIRQQQDNIWGNEQCSSEFDGVIGEKYSLPAMIDFFARHGLEYRNDIRRYK